MRRLDILPLMESLPHDSAHLHVTGAAEYIDDRPFYPNEPHVGLVYSPHAKARIVAIDFSKAMSLPGVVCALKADYLHHNRWGSIFPDQPLLAEHQVNYVGEVIVVVGAESPAALREALKMVKVQYVLEKPILSIDEAIEETSFIGSERLIAKGEAEAQLASSPHRLSGVVTLKGADHFYLENQTAIAYPLEDGQLEIHSSTQHPTETQSLVAEALGLPLSAVVCITKRLGGAFGGKETQAAPFAVYAAMVAHATKRPARLVLSKDDDMVITGKRNPYQVHYQVGFDAKGLMTALDCHLYGDGGAYADLSTAVLERAMTHVDNAYFIPHARIRGVVCRTNYHPHTAFRGFGGPKGVAVIEHIMEEIGHFLQIDALDIRKLNCYQGARNVTPYGQTVANNLLPELFTTLEERCDYRARRSALDAWNQDPEHNPRGMSLTAIKFGISFITRFLNQGHALVHIFRDGSVQVATGAVEMGQGVQVRIKSLVAEFFGLKAERVRVLATATDKSANTSPTAASSGTDLNGTAAVAACQQLKERLAAMLVKLIDVPLELWPQKTAGLGFMPEIDIAPMDNSDVVFEHGRVYVRHTPEQSVDFADLVNAAYLSRLPLSAYGFYKVPGLDFNKLSGQGQAFLYFTQGVACSEVEIDRFTGEVKVLRADILMDVGRPINEAMDNGQIAGGFIQGVGYVTTENLFYNQEGRLMSHSPSTYKIPNIHDIPRIFNIELVKNEGNTVNLQGTKASGEPPLMLCFSVWNALKNALAYRHRGQKGMRLAKLPVPATAEVVLRELRPHAFLAWEQPFLASRQGAKAHGNKAKSAF